VYFVSGVCSYRDKKVVGVFCAVFRAPLQYDRDEWIVDAVMSAEVVTITFAASFANSVTIFLLTFFWRLQFSACPL
jgi:hypothetical protein